MPDTKHHNELKHSTRSHRTRIPAVPDLRFEHSYLRSVRSLVHIQRVSSVEEGIDGPELGSITTHGHDDQLLAITPPSEIIRVHWPKVAWITARDQVISPFLQGALWGIASQFIMPIIAQTRSRLTRYFTTRFPQREGKGVSWLRGWVKGLGLSGLSNSPSR